MTGIAAEVAAVYDGYRAAHRRTLLAIRELVYEVAEAEQAGPLQEYLAWGQPSYRARAGTPIRLAPHTAERVGLFVPCSTTLIEQYRGLLGHLEFSGNRAVLLDPERALPQDELRVVIAMALTYHRRRDAH